MGKKCYFCGKRRAKYPTIIYPAISAEKEVELCCICYKKYKKIKDRYLVKAYQAMVDLHTKEK